MDCLNRLDDGSLFYVDSLARYHFGENTARGSYQASFCHHGGGICPEEPNFGATKSLSNYRVAIWSGIFADNEVSKYAHGLRQYWPGWRGVKLSG